MYVLYKRQSCVRHVQRPHRQAPEVDESVTFRIELQRCMGRDILLTDLVFMMENCEYSLSSQLPQNQTRN